jgi:hypothetical protein
LGLGSLSGCLQNRNISETSSVSVFRHRSARHKPWVQTFSIAAHHRKSNMLGCALENRSSSDLVQREVIGKWPL